MLQIHKASAGSGKTYTLAYNYIKLLLGYKDENGTYRLSPETKRHRAILAITFTNKATEEMKRRIVHQLALLAGHGDRKGDYEDRLCKELSCTPERLRQSAAKALNSLLGDYGNFNVSTIDSFFQTVLRAFAREANLTGNYDVDLDDANAITVGIDAMLSQINRMTPHDRDADKRMHLIEAWLMQFMKSLMRDGKKFLIFNRSSDIFGTLQTFVRNALSETYKINAKVIDAYLDDPDKIRSFMAAVRKVRDEYPRMLASYATVRLEAIRRDGTAGSMKAVLRKRLEEWAAGEMKLSGTTLPGYLANYENGYLSKKYPGDVANAPVLDMVRECMKMCREYEFLDLIRSQLHYIGLLGEIQYRMNENQTGNNAILLRDTNDILRRIISEEEAPFIYERLGVRLRHFLIDEFQDTSRMQWLNLDSLLKESLATDNDSLIIGDEKQSIYRFRNSDVDLIVRDVPREFAGRCEMHGNIPEENTNWRSAAEVVRFNNTFFTFLASVKGVSDIYANVIQAVAKEKMQGYVKAVRYDEKGEILDAMAGEIKRQLASGFSQGDITILVRTADEGALIVADLLRRKNEDEDLADIQIMSEDALIIGNCRSVQLITSVMHDMARRVTAASPGDRDKKKRTPDDIYSRMQYFLSSGEDKEMAVADAFSDKEVPDEFVSEILSLTGSSLPSVVERIIKRYVAPERLAADNVFICAFQDIVLDFSERPGADLHSFLKWWDDRGSTKESLALPAEVDAIKVMTIHKSKGLEFKCVHVPFVDWSWGYTRHGELVWFDTSDPATGELHQFFGNKFAADIVPPFIPLIIRSELPDTPFEEQSQVVVGKRYLDVLNCAYVAFTRAVRELFIGYKSGKDGMASVGGCLSLAFQSVTPAYSGTVSAGSGLLMSFSDKVDGEGTFEAGEPVLPGEKDGASVSMPMPPYYSYDNEHVWSMSRIEDFDEMMLPRRKGVIFHDIMSGIRTAGDLDMSVRRCVMKGFVTESESGTYRRLLGEALADDRVKPWFCGFRRLLTERPFVMTYNGEVSRYRPDRVVWTADGHIDVIDYKFGEEESDKYRRQVSRYMRAVGRMFKGVDVRGYLWYPLQGAIEEVK